LRNRLLILSILMISVLTATAQTTALDWYNQGTSKGLSEEYMSAIDCFTKALNLQPDFEDALYNRGLCLFRKKQYKQALLDFTTILQKNMESARAYNQRGLTRSALGDHNGAVADFTDAITLQSNDPIFYYNRSL